MDDQSIQQIVGEMQRLIVGRAPGKIFQLGPAALAIDFGLRDQGYLFLNAEPNQPRLYLIRRRVRDLEKLGQPLTAFAQGLKKELANTRLQSLEKDPSDRIVRFEFAGADELGEPKRSRLLAQLTGRSANLLLLDHDHRIIQTARPTDVAGQQIGNTYSAPAGESGPPAASRESKLFGFLRARDPSWSLSQAADDYFTSLLEQKAFANQVAAARAEIRRKLTQQQKLLRQLESDLKTHANAAEQKRLGDLLLANLSTAERRGNRVSLIDYFADGAPQIEIELDESVSLPDEATRRFGLYSRSKRAVSQITSRIDEVRARLSELESEQQSLEQELAANRLPVPLQSLKSLKSAPPPSAAGIRKSTQKIRGTRRYLSSDGIEILVGRTARDNDHLTFKIARPNDLWLHAADYGGSHVVIRHGAKKPVPHRTLIEAAQLAAWFSQAKKDPKVDVHYTERKFVSKIKGAKPGLVRLQRFKNLTVEPKEAGTRD
jgi:predicted ribosome quality control (RQC) complex YloA/Tae2 family protein